MKNLALLFFLFIFTGALAQEHVVFSPISSINGLSDNRVRTICQLADGRMVIVTEGLVNIYNGASFHYLHYDEKKAYHLQKYSGFHRAYVDNENRLWIKNQHKLMLFDIRTELFVPNIDSIFSTFGVENPVADFFMDTNFNFWLLSEKNELLLRNAKTNNVRIILNNILKESPFLNDQLYDLAVRDKQLFLFFKSGEMVCYDIETSEEKYRENPFGKKENPYSNTLMVVAHKQYLYQARNGDHRGQLVRFNTLNRKWERILDTDYWLNTLTIDPEGTCWISSFTGLWKIDENLRHKQLLSPLHLVDGQSFDCEISTQFNDNQGGLWVGTVNRGIVYYHPDRFKFRNYGSSLFKLPESESVSIFSIAEYKGQVLIGTQAGLFSYPINSLGFEAVSWLPKHPSCEMLFTDSQNRLWVCTRDNGLYCHQNGQTSHSKLAFNCISIYETFDGRLLLCTDQGPGIFDPQSGTFKKAKGEKLTYTYQLTAYRQDTLLGYSNEGLFFLNSRSNTVTIPDKNHSLRQHNNQHYHCLYTDSQGLIWLGTRDGLNVYNPANQSTICFYEDNGLVNNSIRSVIEDDSGRIWVSTSNGISCIEAMSNEGNFQFHLTNYMHFDGIIKNEFLPRSVCKTNDGRLFWGGLDGFNEIDLRQIDKAKPPLYRPLFTRFLLAGTEVKMGESYDENIILKQSISTSRELRLRHHQNFFSIEFSALNYMNPAQTGYRYRLAGVDAEWREIKTTDGIGRADYTKLMPGTYGFKVQATNNNQQWDNNAIAELSIVITPPFWKTTWAYLVYLVFFFGLVFSILLFAIRRNLEKTRLRQKEELDQMKFKFFTNISHELRTPLTLIITPLDSLIKKINDETVKKQLVGISQNANELLKQVNQLLAFRKFEVNGETLNLRYCNMGEFVENQMPPFKTLAHENEIKFEFFRPETDVFLFADQDKLRIIINNLLSNAFKFTEKGGKIQVTVRKDEAERQVLLQVSDNGCGISRDEQAQIFERFYQVKNQQNRTGSGIGLHLVKEYAQLHNGNVQVESRLGGGSVFTVLLSCDLKPSISKVEHNGENENNKALKLLLVDDHTEFRNFLFSELSEKYRVIMATDGKEGLQKARDEQPDLIVSDVMMPVMSGIELCRQLKADLSISHIPVILLTAINSDESQIEGFEAGADAYIPKPFNMEILLLRIENLLEQQAQRKELFKKSIVITPATVAISNVDEELIRKALGHIEANMDNGTYSVEQLSKDMNMDRTGLYRKLTAITGQTPTEFIRAVRLKKAAQLLQLGRSVAEVAEQVGFGSGSYFTKCFQEEFGVKPSQYKK